MEAIKILANVLITILHALLKPSKKTFVFLANFVDLSFQVFISLKKFIMLNIF